MYRGMPVTWSINLHVDVSCRWLYVKKDFTRLPGINLHVDVSCRSYQLVLLCGLQYINLHVGVSCRLGCERIINEV